MTYKELFDLLGWDKEVCECGQCDSAFWCKDCKNYGRNCGCLVPKFVLEKAIKNNREKKEFLKLAIEELK